MESAARRHVHDLFASNNTENTWRMWIIDLPHENGAPIPPSYSGNRYAGFTGVDAGGSKRGRARDLVGCLNSHTAATASVWFDHNKVADRRLAGTSESAAAPTDALHRRHTPP